MKPILKTLLGFAGLVLLGLVPLAGAHGQDGEGGMNMDMSMDMDMDVTSTVAAFASYFQHSEHSGLIFAHILLMTVGWIFVLPIGERNPEPIFVPHFTELSVSQLLCYQSLGHATAYPCKLHSWLRM